MRLWKSTYRGSQELSNAATNTSTNGDEVRVHLGVKDRTQYFVTMTESEARHFAAALLNRANLIRDGFSVHGG